MGGVMIPRSPCGAQILTLVLNEKRRREEKVGGNNAHAGISREIQEAYHGGLCDRAEAVDENVAGDVYRRTCETENRNEPKIAFIWYNY